MQESIFEALEEHVKSKEEAKKRLVAVGAVGASVNMGTNKGQKALITSNNGDTGTDASLIYLGWFWIIYFHCENHLMELGIQDMEHNQP